MNVGVAEALRLEPATTCFILHDVDLLPMHLCTAYECDVMPRHLCALYDKFKHKLVNIFQQYLNFACGHLSL